MRILLLIPALFVPVCANAGLLDKLGDIQSEVFTTDGTQAAIARRGESCIARLVRNESLRDEAPGPVITNALPDSGLVVAHSRLIEHTFALNFVIQSVLTFEAKDGRFRLTYSDIEAGSDTGNGHVVFDKINAKARLGKDAAELISDLTGKIAACVRGPSPDF